MLSLRGIRKSFGHARALDGVDLSIRHGEFIGLMGPNGAGKSTLIKILDGVHHPDSGEIHLDGQPLPSLRGRPEAGFVHQDLALVEALSISENLRLGQPPLHRLGPFVNHHAEERSARDALLRVGLDRSPRTLVADLSPGERALVAVARALDRGARLVVVDEATSTLAPSDARRLITSLRRVVADGATVMMVSHKLSEILGVADRIVVLVDGRISVDRPRAGLDHEDVVRMLYAHEVDGTPPQSLEPGEVLLTATGARGAACGPVDLKLRAGQVIGMTGLPGSGLHEVALLLAGQAPVRRGRVSAARHVRRALVPPHRETQGGFLDQTVLTNLTISSLRSFASYGGALDKRRERSEGGQLLEELAVVPRSSEAGFDILSGGNKQKVIFGRAILSGAKVFVLCEPTRGVDVQTRAELYRLIRRLAGEGAGVLIFSSDAEDLFAVCDSVGVVENGRITTLQPRSALTIETIEELV